MEKPSLVKKLLKKQQKVLTAEELRGVTKRQQLIQSCQQEIARKQAVFAVIQSELQLYMNELLDKHGCETGIDYNVNFETGIIEKGDKPAPPQAELNPPPKESEIIKP